MLPDHPPYSLLKSNFIILKATMNILTEHYSTAEVQLEEIIDMYDKNPHSNTVHWDVLTHAFICLANIKGRRLMRDGFGIDFALKCYNRALLIDSENEDIYYHRAKLYTECGQLNNARNDFERSMKLSIFFIEAKCKYLRLKFDLALNANDEDAKNAVLAEFEEISNKFKDSCVLFSNYAEVLTLIGKYEEAIKKLQIAIGLDKKDPNLCLQMGKILLKASKNIEVLYEWCNKALNADCECIVALEILGLIWINIMAYDVHYFMFATFFSQDKNEVKNLFIVSMASIEWHNYVTDILTYEGERYHSALRIFRTYFFTKFAPKYMSTKAKEIISDVTYFLRFNVGCRAKMERYFADAQEVMGRLEGREVDRLVSTSDLTTVEFTTKTFKEIKCFNGENNTCHTCKLRKADGLRRLVFE
ncbi:Mitochondrial import receptor subunit TOM70-like protein [Leptotrombidium deliense]|uniref:Mitochondrial import receptor subunit TOM70-like protein n=1 Tax=Leptotrombidium deliense TaxID=299467 RepID=A0A443S080_9ACAR|nr:Mitochondrial import receptor subunit TOM70-like protein [Leptotrombidium deliense]